MRLTKISGTLFRRTVLYPSRKMLATGCRHCARSLPDILTRILRGQSYEKIIPGSTVMSGKVEEYVLASRCIPVDERTQSRKAVDKTRDI